MDESENKPNDWVTFGYGLGIGFLIMVVYWFFKGFSHLPENYAWCLVGGIGFIAGLARIWYSTFNSALSFNAGILLTLAVFISLNLGYSKGWYHALIAVAALVIAQLIKAAASQATH